MKITDFKHMREPITSQCAEIDGNADLFHRLHLNFAKRIRLCIENDGKSCGKYSLATLESNKFFF